MKERLILTALKPGSVQNMAAADLGEARAPFQDLENIAKLPEIGLTLDKKASQSFVIDFEGDDNQNANLQDAFIKYKKKRQVSAFGFAMKMKLELSNSK